MLKRLNIVLVESAYLLSSGVENLLSEFPGLFLVAHFDGSEKNLSEKIIHNKPDVAIVNPDCIQDGLLTLLNQLHLNHTILVVALVSKKTPENIKSHFGYYLSLEDGKHEMLKSFKSILGDKLQQKANDKSATALSDREQTIVKQVVSGLTNQEIADKLFLSIHTVNTHRKNISNKLGIKTVSGLTVYALMNKIVHIHEIEHK